MDEHRLEDLEADDALVILDSFVDVSPRCPSPPLNVVRMRKATGAGAYDIGAF